MKSVVNTPQGPVVREIAEPVAAGPHEALVAVRAFSINRGELALLKMRTDHWRPGQDIAGVVVEAAADGSGPAPGTRVAALVEGAGWSEQVAVPTDRLAVLPDTVTVEQAAALPLAASPRCGRSASPAPSWAAECWSPAPTAASDASRSNWRSRPARR
ncbi:alcohol dehydrogenase catalytic domain-containing protein [Catenulispora yoronensis]